MNKLGIFHFYEEHPLGTNESLEEIGDLNNALHCSALFKLWMRVWVDFHA